MTNKNKSVYWTQTKVHDEAGVVIFGSVAVPVVVLIAGFILANVLLMVGLAFQPSWVPWAVYGYAWLAVFCGFMLYALGVLFKYLWDALKAANDWKVGGEK